MQNTQSIFFVILLGITKKIIAEIIFKQSKTIIIIPNGNTKWMLWVFSLLKTFPSLTMCLFSSLLDFITKSTIQENKINPERANCIIESLTKPEFIFFVLFLFYPFSYLFI